MTTQEYLESAEEVLFVLKVDMGKEKFRYINFCRGDTPENAALSFCKDNGLNIDIYDFLVETLVQKEEYIMGTKRANSKQSGQKTRYDDYDITSDERTATDKLKEVASTRLETTAKGNTKSSERILLTSNRMSKNPPSSSSKKQPNTWRAPQQTYEEKGSKTREDVFKSSDVRFEVKPKSTKN